MDFYQKYLKICAERNVSPSKAAVDAGLSKNAVSRWKNNHCHPTDANIKKLEVYFGVPEHFFNEEKETPPANDGKRQNRINRITAIISNLSDEQLSRLEDQLLTILSER